MFANSPCLSVPSLGPFGWDTRNGVHAGFRKATGQTPTRTVEASQVPNSVVVRRNSLMQLPEFTRSTTPRWTILVAGLFAAFIVALLGYIYLKPQDDLAMRSDRMIVSQMGLFANLSPERRLDALKESRTQLQGSLLRSSSRTIWW
jgi:hypothetical protein